MAASLECPRPWTRTDSLLAVASLGLSVAPVVLIGVQWLATWAKVGQRPAYNWGMGDPDSFGGVLDVLYTLSTLSVILLHGMPLVSLFWWLAHRRSPTGRIMALSTLVLSVSSYAILWADPLGIVSWCLA